MMSRRIIVMDFMLLHLVFVCHMENCLEMVVAFALYLTFIAWKCLHENLHFCKRAV